MHNAVTAVNFFYTFFAFKQADTWGNSQGAMFESVLKTSCEIIEFGWSKDRSPVDTFIMGLATSIRERADYEEEVSFILLVVSQIQIMCNAHSFVETQTRVQPCACVKCEIVNALCTCMLVHVTVRAIYSSST